MNLKSCDISHATQYIGNTHSTHYIGHTHSTQYIDYINISISVREVGNEPVQEHSTQAKPR